MKKIIAMLLVLVMAASLVACGGEKAPETTAAPATEAPATEAPAAAAMTHEEYMAAELDAEVVIETYVQGHQSWWDNKITVYCQSPDGAYFLYELACSEEDAAKLVPGTKIKVTGHKAAWAGEVEIMDATFEFAGDTTWTAEAMDATALLGTDELITHQNKKVAFKGMTVEASKDASGNEAAFLYNWDGSGSADSDSDLYFNVSVNGNTYTFCVEYYLCGPDSDAYKAVQALKVGDVIDLEGFLYWYEGVQPHVTGVSAAK